MVKKAKFLFSISLIMLLMLTSVYFPFLSVLAENGEINNTNPQTSFSSISSNSSIIDYSKYLFENKGLKPATSKIHISGGDYSSEQNSSVEKISSHEGKTNVLRWDSQKGNVTYDFSVESDGFYSIYMTYLPIECRGNDIRLGLKIDGEYIFDGMKEIVLPRLWTNDGDVRVDEKGDELTPEQIELFSYTEQAIKDKEGIATEPYKFALRSGSHSITIEMKEEAFVLAEISFVPPEEVLPYSEASKKYSSYGQYEGSPIVIEGEDADIKTSNSLIGKSENNINLTPSSAKNLLINYIGSTNWKTPGDTLIWKFYVDKPGLYKLCFKYKQSDYLNGISYRTLKIDGITPFAEAQAIPFD